VHFSRSGVGGKGVQVCYEKEAVVIVLHL